MCSVQFSHSVVSSSLRPHEAQHARPPCPSPTPGVHSDSHPSSQWCHPAISSSVVPFTAKLDKFIKGLACTPPDRLISFHFLSFSGLTDIRIPHSHPRFFLPHEAAFLHFYPLKTWRYLGMEGISLLFLLVCEEGGSLHSAPWLVPNFRTSSVWHPSMAVGKGRKGLPRVTFSLWVKDDDAE